MCAHKQGEGQRERESQADAVLSVESGSGFDLTNLRSDLSRNQESAT